MQEFQETTLEQQIQDVALRIKTLREVMDISLEEMAKSTNVTLAQYQKYELGEEDFSFTFIYKCAKRFGVDSTDLIKGVTPKLTTYTITRKGGGLPITRRKGFKYNNLAPLFRNKTAEPFLVKIPYNAAEQEKPIQLSTHMGQEFDIVIKGCMKMQVGDHVEYLHEGDTIYYNSGVPHGMIAVDGGDVEIYALVLKSVEEQVDESDHFANLVEKHRSAHQEGWLYEKFVSPTVDENGILTDIKFFNEEHFNFAFDVIDELAKKCPDKLAMLHVSRDKQERRFTYRDISRYSAMTANYFKSLGIGKGDRVMLVLKRHYQFWFSILALHKLGAVVIPATNLLMEHDFEYRFNAAEVKALICTADGETAAQAQLAAARCKTVETLVMVGDKREGWHDFNAEFWQFSDVFTRQTDSPCGSDLMMMFFTSGTTGNPKIAMHNYKYPLGHFITAKYWQNVNPDGLHLSISDTGWGKALWGKIYGQWLCEATIFVYDFDRFDVNDILPMFKRYNITTFCAPPTMYRFFIREDLSKYDLSSIEHCCIAGEALNPEVFEQWKKGTGLNLMEGFGQTETTVVIYNPVGTNPKPGSMGKPCPLYDVDILLPDGSSAPVGETGEIVIRTDKKHPCGLFFGYYDQGKTEEVWYDGAYHMGDTAWRDEDGYFWYVGRVDDLIKSSGYRIGPFEIESVLMELPYVLECAVTGAPDPIRGQVVKATIVLTKDTVGTEELKKEIQMYVKKHTAPYKYPRVVEFLAALPKTSSGKIRRVDIRNNDILK
ncbi:MAG: AMP-binding protein [Clostridiales bacterium]